MLIPLIPVYPLYHGCLPSKHFHIGPISARCRNIDVGFRYRADIYNCTVKYFFSNYWVFNGLLMLIHLVFYIVTSHKCTSRLINIMSLLFAICTIAYFTAASFIWEFEFWRHLESNGDTRELKKSTFYLVMSCSY